MIQLSSLNENIIATVTPWLPMCLLIFCKRIFFPLDMEKCALKMFPVL